MARRYRLPRTTRRPSAISPRRWRNPRRPGRAGSGSTAADEQQADGRGDVGDGVDQDGHRSGQGLHEQAGQARPADLGHRGAGGELAVALHQLLAPHQRRQVGKVGQVEEDCPDPHQRHDPVQVPQLEPALPGQQGHRQEQGRAQEVGHHHQRAAPAAVHPRPGQQRQHDEGQELGGAQQAELACAGVQ